MTNKNQHSYISPIGARTHGKITALYERSGCSDPKNIRRQRNNLATYASNKGFQNLRHFTDDGYAGTNTDRPAFKQLMDHLREIDREANEQFDSMMDGYKQKWNITEALKAEDPMRWVGLMNNARNEVEWFITKELIFN